MGDKLKIIIIGAGAMVGSFALMIGVIWFILSGRNGAASEPPAAVAGQPAPPQAVSKTGEPAAKGERVPGGEVLSYTDVLGENIPLEPKVEGYQWAKWGITSEAVQDSLLAGGVKEIENYKPQGGEFISVVALNPDNKRFKVEYRFYNNALFYVEVYYSDFYKSYTFNAFLLDRMTEYGRPFDQFATVDEMGNVILHAKWDTEDSQIELVGRPDSYYSLFLNSQVTMIKLEEARKAEERLAR